MPDPSNQRKAVALLIGIGDYLHAQRIAPLRFATRDAKALARLLLNPDVSGFPHDQLMLLTDRRARRDRIVHYLSKWLPAQAKGVDLVWIYFAGHGMVQAVGQREEGFLLPYDADPEDVVTRGVAMSDVGRWIDGIDAGAVVVCLDCCHAGKVILRDAAEPRSPARDLEIRPAVIQGIAGKGRFLIASCDHGQKSLEAEDLGHGLFTYHLLQGIAGAGDRDGDGKVGVAELFNYVSAAVAKDAREKFGREQKPWTSATWAEDVYVSSPKAGEATRTSIERICRDEGTQAAIRRIEEKMVDADEASLKQMLRSLRTWADPAGIPAIFGCLTHSSQAVREQARKAVHAIGLDKTAAVVEALAARADGERVARVLDGLAAFEAHPQVVSLLDRFVAFLRGDHRNRAILLLDRKRLALELDKVAALFREVQSPYQIQKVLGQGLFTSAYLARVEAADLEVVVRVLRAEFVNQPQVRAQFLDLANQSLRFIHHNLVLTREARAFPDHHVYYTVRDYVDGVTLQRLLEAGKKFDSQQTIEILRQLLNALTPLHEHGLHHGGIKPSNIFVCAGDRVILGDPSLGLQGIGLALERLSYDYRYAPPEMFRSGGVLGPQSDFYALGCVAYELLCGQPPFVSDNYLELAAMHLRETIAPPSSRGARVLPFYDALVLRFLDPLPEKRFSNLTEAIAQLPRIDAYSLEAGPTPRIEIAIPILQPESLAECQAAQSIMPFSGTVSSALDEEGMHSQPIWASPPLTGKVGRYEILGPIAQGAMGVVYKARDSALKRVVALKVLPAAIGDQPQALARFLRESQAVAQLHHPNIAPIFDIGEYEGHHYFAMLFAQGGSLQKQLERYVADPKASAGLIEKVARAVQYAHEQGFLHRDLKPANILLDERGEPLVSDFGLAKFRDPQPTDLTVVGQIMGTPAYMSPEQASGESIRITQASDVWSLGVILYQLLTGRQPFPAEGGLQVLHRIISEDPLPPRTHQSNLDRDLEAICLKCLQKDSALRYPSAGALADDLHHWLHSEPISAKPIPAAQQGGQAVAQGLHSEPMAAKASSGWKKLWQRISGRKS